MSAVSQFKALIEELKGPAREQAEKQVLADMARLRAFQFPLGRAGEIALCQVQSAAQAECLACDPRIFSIHSQESLTQWLKTGRELMLLVRRSAGLTANELTLLVQNHPTLRTVFVEA